MTGTQIYLIMKLVLSTITLQQTTAKTSALYLQKEITGNGSYDFYHVHSPRKVNDWYLCC